MTSKVDVVESSVAKLEDDTQIKLSLDEEEVVENPAAPTANKKKRKRKPKKNGNSYQFFYFPLNRYRSILWQAWKWNW